jgi:hypothetical protein
MELRGEIAGYVNGWLDTLLLGGLAALIGVFVFVSAIEGWRLWSERRRIGKHFRH